MDSITLKISLVSMVADIKGLTPEERVALTKEWYDWVMEVGGTASVTKLEVIQ